MKNHVVISSLILGLIGASGLASAQTSSRDSGASGSMSSGSPSDSSSGRMQSGSGSEASTSGEAKSGSTVGNFIDDATVTTRVKSRFAQDDQVSAMNIGVETNDGVVQLSGYAGSEAEKVRAAEIAGQVPDVRSVQNNITVRSEGGSTAPGSGTGSGSGSAGMGTGSSGSDTGSTSR